MILVETFVHTPGQNYYTSTSITGDETMWMISWIGSEEYGRFSAWPDRNRNHWRKVF